MLAAQGPRPPLRAATYETFFGLLAVTRLRIDEATLNGNTLKTEPRAPSGQPKCVANSLLAPVPPHNRPVPGSHSRPLRHTFATFVPVYHQRGPGYQNASDRSYVPEGFVQHKVPPQAVSSQGHGSSGLRLRKDFSTLGVSPSDSMREIPIDGWNDLQDKLYADSWSESLQRFRSPYLFRGLSDKTYSLETTLMRLGGPYAKLEHHLLRNFRKYAPRTVVERDSIWNWLLPQHHGHPRGCWIGRTSSCCCICTQTRADATLTESSGR
jgi:hypothetical protein